jgi:hypothetical protein
MGLPGFMITFWDSSFSSIGSKIFNALLIKLESTARDTPAYSERIIRLHATPLKAFFSYKRLGFQFHRQLIE